MAHVESIIRAKAVAVGRTNRRQKEREREGECVWLKLKFMEGSC